MAEVVLNALTLSSILVLVALGLAIVFGLMNIINMAHGEFVMLGAFTLSFVQARGGSFWLGLLSAAVVGALFGFLLERLIVRHLYERPMAAILATWGVSLILQHSMQLAFGAAPRLVNSPIVGAFQAFGVTYPAYRIFLIASAIVVVGAVVIVLRRTTFGLDLRTVIEDREVAELLGIDTKRVFTIAFCAGTALAGLAGALVAPLAKVVVSMGANYLAPSFFVVIVGGAGSLPGVVAGSLLVGTLQTLLEYEIPATFSQALVLIASVAIVRVRPRGLVPA
jgi:branched-chain amino acid transport system permease protein/urea transport system permease protein